jgi:hypothetical protein
MLLAALFLIAALEVPAPQPDPPVVLRIYPKLLPPQDGETILEQPHAPGPEDGISDDPFERAKDPRTFA